ncbi:hypothetical protein ACFQ34_33875 [Pseudonocardia benzenivorans]|uniref:Uncharacterized protein n=1 Tax=Pseudonocardia benzenivorans TaxID=228005 RepID=A0ABW3VT06_9PSEU
MRERLTTLLELAGLAAVTAGAALIYVPAGFITGGVFAVGVGVLLGLPGAKGEQR